MNPPGGSATPAGGICTQCPHGKIEVIVWKHAICWDTPSEGWPNARDPVFAGVKVRLNETVASSTTRPDGTQDIQYTNLAEQTTSADGKVTFANLLPFDSYTITASRHPDYEEITADLAQARETVLQGNQLPPTQPGVAADAHVQLRTEVAVEVGHTSYADLVLRKKKYRENADGTWTQGRECNRRHPPPSGAAGGSGGGLASILWDDEPGTLATRDWGWIIFLVLIAACIVAGAVGFPFALFLGGIFVAFEGYLTGVIFGEGPGTVAIGIAIAVFAALAVAAIVLAVLIRMGGSPLSDVDKVMIPALFGILSGMWASFGVAYVQSPPETYQARPEWWSNVRLLGLMLIGVVVYLLIHLVFAALFGFSTATIVAVLVGLIFAVLWCHHAALTGFTFKSEGQVKEFGATDFTLPYLGERYCLQGSHGYWSHFAGGEGAYDWSVPDRTNVLCAKEGHIIAYYDQNQYERYLPLLHPNDDVHQKTGSIPYREGGSTATEGANYIAVRHRDGSAAFYSWLMTNGVAGRAWTPPLRAELGSGRDGERAVQRGGGNASDVRDSGGFNGIYVEKGSVLGGCGYTDSDNPETYAPFPDAPAWWTVGVGAAVMVAGIIFVIVLGAIYSGTVPAVIGTGMDTATNSYCPPASQVTSASNLPSACTNPGPTVQAMFHADEGYDNQYCEAVQQPALIKQPWATISAPIGFGPCGLALLIIFARGGPNGKPYKNRMTATWWYPLTLGLVLIINGPGSMIFHTTFNGFWSELDPCGMCLFTGFVAAYNITRMANLAQGWFWLMFVAMVALSVFLIFYIGSQPGGDSTPVFAGSVGIAMITQFLTIFFCHIITHRTGITWFWIGLLTFGLALTIWDLGHTGHALCSSRFIAFSFPWPHPLWHLMGAFAMFCFGMSFIYQKDPEPCYPRLHLEAIEIPPPGPSLDAPEPASNGVTHNLYKTVKFTDGSTAIHANQPRSMRKYRSDNTPKPKPTITPVELFRPQGGGSHTVPIDGA